MSAKGSTQVCAEIANRLREQKVPDTAVIHVQTILNAFVSARTMPQLSDLVRAKELTNATQLVFMFSVTTVTPYSIALLLQAISDPVNCVTAASAKFTPGATPGIEIAVTVSWAAKTRDRDRDGPVSLVTERNQIDNSFAEAGLSGAVLKAAQAAQLLMINNHPKQPLVSFSIDHDPTVAVRAANVDSIDLIRLARLQSAHKNITDVTIGLVPPHYELIFTIENNAAAAQDSERNRKRFWIF